MTALEGRYPFSFIYLCHKKSSQTHSFSNKPKKNRALRGSIIRAGNRTSRDFYLEESRAEEKRFLSRFDNNLFTRGERITGASDIDKKDAKLSF